MENEKDLNKNMDNQDIMAIRKYHIRRIVAFSIIVSLTISILSIPLKQTLALILFMLIALFMGIFYNRIVDIVWSGVR